MCFLFFSTGNHSKLKQIKNEAKPYNSVAQVGI